MSVKKIKQDKSRQTVKSQYEPQKMLCQMLVLFQCYSIFDDVCLNYIFSVFYLLQHTKTIKMLLLKKTTSHSLNMKEKMLQKIAQLWFLVVRQ